MSRVKRSRTDTSEDEDWKESFEKLIKVEKPEDSFDYKVTIGENSRCDSSKLKEGSIVYRPARIIIVNKNSNGLTVRNQDIHKISGDSADWILGNKLIDDQCWSSDQYTKIEKVTMTKLATIIKEEIGDCVCKIEFTKMPDVGEMAKLIREGSLLIENSNTSETEKNKMFKKLYERSQEGEYRIIRGYIARSSDLEAEETETGMIKFLDAELFAQGKFAQRIVNLRTIKSLTFKLTKYLLK